jgi:hypothetical protein
MSKPIVSSADALVRREAIINSACEQFRALLDSHFNDAAKAANDSFTGDDTKAEPKAKISASVKWDALSTSPRVAVKIAFGARYKDESEEELDPLQAKLGIETAQ